MTIKSHIVTMIIGVIVCGGIAAISSDQIESSGFPLELVFFIAISIGWIIPRLLFAFVFHARYPACGNHAIHKADFHPKPIYYVCKKCGYSEKTIWTQGRHVQ